ncbi:MAG: alanine racemase [Gallionellales bacterium RIFCSPLOWO2_12_FULL_57_18]|nr:MAG: alanine racemase [Gallionellales bacterium RIFCSPLOWO2_12_FULL_57_18]OGS94268.1 MAG: alanine racemase [Gallionellales bacterium RIFCSPLOWO2_02_FULL_57_47]
MHRPIQAHINQSALENNLHVARRATSARLMSIIKADGYGHGMLRVAGALSASDGFALLDIQDAMRLREAGFRQTILILEGFFGAEDLALFAEYDLTCVIHSAWQLALLDAYPKSGKLDVWLKVNSGMNRLGFVPQQVAQAMEQLRRHRAVREITLMTHFANADEARGVAEPLALFNDVAAPYRISRSLANSAALLRYPETHGDWVRPGLMLYGASPFADASAQQLGLKPAMTLSSRIIAVQELRAGDEIGYGALFRAEHAMRIGIVACGYADGYPRHAPNGTPVLVDGQRAQTLGRVSMDMLYVDLSKLPQAGVGSRVVLWGEGMPIEEVARAAGTVSYELMCALTARVPVVV